MENFQIVPIVIDEVPEEILEVVYADDKKVDLGNELTPTEVKDIPVIVKWHVDPGCLYTLYMADLDPPSRDFPTFREWHHWLVINIPGNNIDEGETISEYIGAGPPEDTGLHRYIFLIFREKKKFSCINEPHLTANMGDFRGKFSIKNFAKKYKLILQAGNFFQAQWDTYVPILYSQIRGA